MVGFLVAVATIIPVLLVAYVLGVNKIIRQTLGQRYTQSFKVYSQQVDEAMKNKNGRAKHVAGALTSAVMANVYQNVLIGLFVIAVALPSIGEYEALHALYVDRASSVAKMLSLFGALTAGAIVIAPLAYTTFRQVLLPVVVVAIGRDHVTGDQAPVGAASVSLTYIYVQSDEQTFAKIVHWPQSDSRYTVNCGSRNHRGARTIAGGRSR